MYLRKTTRQVKIGNKLMGGGADVLIQSMLNVPAHDFEGNIAQAKALEAAGCEIIRVSVPDIETVKLIPLLKDAVSVPIVADIHFDHRLALESVAAGVDKVRINPGNIGEEQNVKKVADACRCAGVPIRIGVNSGSVEKGILAKHGGPTPAALVESGKYHISLLEKYDFNDIVLSLKSSDTQTMYDTYVLAAETVPYPLHLGVTEAGTAHMGLVRSAAGIGGLLLRGIGDTIRVSLTDDPVKEIAAAKDILSATGVRCEGARIVSCPTCGRTKVNLIELANEAEKALAGFTKNITVAIMGCAVNGPGEAREADIGIAGGDGCGLIFKKGEIIRKVPQDELFAELMKEIKNEYGEW
ncbi:MAG: flavodoxin-dependent (E)-4-hydroxy-3-methylbut-2-enyl-diphosphate synthase [Ruminococcaceae bacterium]|nr:flavodoxin-dependent (E)-4-hydroxy-3-methylbut-2-enyl-diphosphate synthase [Oscillospiraceae bacterium]